MNAEQELPACATAIDDVWRAIGKLSDENRSLHRELEELREEVHGIEFQRRVLKARMDERDMGRYRWAT